jgi:hypothetical protein
MSHTPTSAQLTQLAALAASRATAESTLSTNQAALLTAQNNYKNSPSAANSAALTTALANLATAGVAYRNSASDHAQYRSYIYGGVRPGYDAGGPDAV